jgi:putative transposase
MQYGGLKPAAWRSLASAVLPCLVLHKVPEVALQGDVEAKVKEVFEQVARDRGIGLIEYETMVGHVHMLIAAESSKDLPGHMKLLKGRSAYEVFKAFPEVELDAHVASLWQEGFRSRLVSDSQLERVRHYIRTEDERPAKYEW